MRNEYHIGQSLFPTHVGMYRIKSKHEIWRNSFSHVCGDVPSPNADVVPFTHFSHVCGDVPADLASAQLAIAFSHVCGDVPKRTTPVPPSLHFSHACGDVVFYDHDAGIH